MPIELSESNLGNLSKSVAGPGYDRAALSAGILHVGVGNFHRAHMGVYLNRLFAMGESLDWAIVGAGVRPGDAVMREKLEAQDWLTTVVELDPEGLSASITGGMIEYVPIDPETTIARMSAPDIRILSLTITEGGYYMDARGGFDTNHPDILADVAHPADPKTVFGMILRALKNRQNAGIPPFTILSCDNLPENGDVTRRTVTGLARLSDPDFADWIDANVAFPNSMVDCITPATSDRERDIVRDQFGIIDTAPVVCEPFRQWVMEDHFPTGRPALEKVGVEFVEDVAPYETMKLRILNAGHAAIAYPSALLGHHFVHDAMADPLIAGWLDTLVTRQVIPVLSPIPGVDYHAYLHQAAVRFANPRVGDTIPRLCQDGSNRQPKFILPTLRDALAAGKPLDGLALEVALWCRYCSGTDEAGNDIPPNDEQVTELKAKALDARDRPAAFLEIPGIFGDLADSPAFVSAFSRQLDLLWAEGTRERLQNWIDAQD